MTFREQFHSLAAEDLSLQCAGIGKGHLLSIFQKILILLIRCVIALQDRICWLMDQDRSNLFFLPKKGRRKQGADDYYIICSLYGSVMLLFNPLPHKGKD